MDWKHYRSEEAIAKAPRRDILERFLGIYRRVENRNQVLHLVRIKDGITEGVVFSLNDPDRMFAWIQEWNPKGWNIYFTVNIPKNLLNKKLSKEDMGAAVFVHVDVDFTLAEKKEASDDDAYAEALEKLYADIKGKVRKEPTLTLFSGNGFQLFWKLDERINLLKEPLEAIEDLNKIVVKYFEGDKSCWNVDRVMRFPGTINHPSATKLKYGFKTTTSDIMETSSSEISAGEVFSLWSDGKVIPSNVIDSTTSKETLVDEIDWNTPVPERFLRMVAGKEKRHEKVRINWELRREEFEPDADLSGSGYDFQMTKLLRHRGFNISEIAAVLMAHPYEGGVRDQKKYDTLQKRERQIERAWKAGKFSDGDEFIAAIENIDPENFSLDEMFGQMRDMNMGEGDVARVLKKISQVAKLPRNSINAQYDQFLRGSSEDEFSLNDAGNGQRIHKYFGDILKKQKDIFFKFNGARWEKIEDIDDLKSLVIEAVSHCGIDKWIHKCSDMAKIRAAVAAAKEELKVDDTYFNQSFCGHLLNVKNGTIDLRTGELREFNTADRITHQLKIEYHKDAKAPTWMSSLNLWMQGDQEMIDFLQVISGIIIAGDPREQRFFLFYGPGGSGKSTYLNAFYEILGDLAKTIKNTSLRLKTNDSHPVDMMNFLGSRLVKTDEIPEGMRLDTSVIKSVVTMEKITARGMRENFQEFDPTHTFIMMGNHRPMVTATDEGIWRRLIQVDFGYAIPEHARDLHMDEKLRAEAEGILAWAVEGAVRWNREGLRIPFKVQNASKDYRHDSDSLSNFFEICCRFDNSPAVGDRGTSAVLLYDRYSQWCEESGLDPMGRNFFQKAMIERGRKYEMVSDARMQEPKMGYKGVFLKDYDRFNMTQEQVNQAALVMQDELSEADLAMKMTKTIVKALEETIGKSAAEHFLRRLRAGSSREPM